MNIHKLRILITLIAVMTLVACGRQSKTWEQMDVAEEVMNAKPDSALAILNNIPVANISGEEEAARYALLKSMALDKNYVDTTTFDVLQPAIDYYIKHGTPDEQLRTYYYQGRIYQNQGNDDSAMQSFMRGREFCKDASDTLTMANLLVAQASIQISIYKIDDFTKNNLEAANLYNAIGRYDYEISSLAKALDGGLLNSDKYLTDSVMAVAEERIKQHPELGAVIVPYTLSYALKFGDKKEIADILHHYEVMDSIDDMDRLELAEGYCEIGDVAKAKRIMDSIAPASEASKSLKYLALMPDILEQNEDLAGALQAYKDFYITIDSIHAKIFSHDLLFAKERHEMEKTNMMEIQKRDKIVWLSLCVTLVLLIIICYVYYRYRLDKLKFERKSLEAENLRLKISKLEDESNALKEILEKREDLAKPIEDAIKIRIEMLNGLLASQITENDSYAKPYKEWKDKILQDKDGFMNSTRLAFAASHPKFMEYLEQHGLTIDEINYLCLYAIGLRGKEVGEYIQLKRHYHISSDVRKKLGIDEHQTNIGIYIRKLMKQL